MAAVDVELYVSGDSDYAGPLGGALAVGLVLSGDSDYVGAWAGSVPVGLVLSGDSAILANAMVSGVGTLAFEGDSETNFRLALRPAYVAPPAPTAAAPNPFPGLLVGRIPPQRASTSTIETRPRRKKRFGED